MTDINSTSINAFDEEYRRAVEAVLDAPRRGGRNGQTLSTFGMQMRFDFKRGFPAITAKKLLFKHVRTELAWMLTGDSNIAFLKNRGCNIWDSWADEQGNLGPVYGVQWRNWGSKVDQVGDVIDKLRNDPFSRRIILSAWNVGDLPDMALPPCHAFVQFYVDNERNLHCHLYQRSGDLFLGVPFNIASYSLLTHVLAHVSGLGRRGSLTISFGDLHLYCNHLEQSRKLLRLPSFKPPELCVGEGQDLVDLVLGSSLVGYEHGPFIPASVSK